MTLLRPAFAALAGVAWVALAFAADAYLAGDVTYDEYHRRLTAPLVLSAAAWGAARPSFPRLGWWIVGAGLVLALVGNALEFWGVLVSAGENANVAGGVGAWWGSHAGWASFLIGVLLLAVGAIVVVTQGLRRRTLRWPALIPLAFAPGVLAGVFLHDEPLSRTLPVFGAFAASWLALAALMRRRRRFSSVPPRMRYLALGDSISIDDYTGVRGGGAVSQLARLLDAELVDLTRDGHITDGVRADLERAPSDPDVVTVTAGGNDLLMGRPARAIMANWREIAARLAQLDTTVIVNTVYDPSDGDDEVGQALLGLPPSLRIEFDTVNDGIKALAQEHGFLLGDLERLFHGHGLASGDSWYVSGIEPGLAGATAIAEHWHELLRGAGVA